MKLRKYQWFGNFPSTEDCGEDDIVRPLYFTVALFNGMYNIYIYNEAQSILELFYYYVFTGL